MRLSIPRALLAKAVGLVARALPSKSIKPILDGILIRATDKLSLFATDLEIGCRAETFVLEVEEPGEPGEAILPGEQIVKLLSETDDERVRIEANEKDVRVVTDSADFHLPASNPADFPLWPDFPTEKRHEIAADELATLIRHAIFAAAKKGGAVGAFAFTGVGWSCGEGKLELAAMDRYRCAVDERPCAAFNGHRPEKIPVVPRKAMDLLALMVSNAEKDDVASVSFRPNDALFRCGGFSVYTRLIAGCFIEVARQLPKGKHDEAVINAAALAKALKQARLTTGAEWDNRVVFSFAKNRLTLESQGKGRSKIELACGWTSKDMKVAIPPERVSDFLAILDEGAEIRMQIFSPDAPILCRVGETHRFLVSPLAMTKS